jgi:hypothetical protein
MLIGYSTSTVTPYRMASPNHGIGHIEPFGLGCSRLDYSAQPGKTMFRLSAHYQIC